jgi:predicted ATP-grasp superfamily ATP-dependent carboligase
MPSSWRVRSPEPGAAILIAASSGRALAATVRRAGYKPLVADLFDDEDTRVLAGANRLAGDPQSGFNREALIAALEALAESEAPAGLVYGAGFEDRVELLEDLARRWALFGNQPETVRRVKNPVELARLCLALDIPHPDISFAVPPNTERWLVKSIGGAGGGHVAQAGAWRAGYEPVYFQRFAPGDAISILLVADGADAHVLGASRQWPAPAPEEPFRFGGSLRPADLSPEIERQLTDAGKNIAAAAKLRGLNSIDFLVEGGEFTLIEINPRPGATLDIFEDREGRLFQAHLDACLGRLPRRPLQFDGAAAAGIAYAGSQIVSMPALNWPDWASDRQKPQTALGKNDPLCTVKACAAEPEQARTLMDQRTAFILEEIEILRKDATF